MPGAKRSLYGPDGQRVVAMAVSFTFGNLTACPPGMQFCSTALVFTRPVMDMYFAGRRISAGVEDRLGTVVAQGGSSGPAYYRYGEVRSGTAGQWGTYTRDSANTV